jgi:hypothetical protein
MHTKLDHAQFDYEIEKNGENSSAMPQETN